MHFISFSFVARLHWVFQIRPDHESPQLFGLVLSQLVENWLDVDKS